MVKSTKSRILNAANLLSIIRVVLAFVFFFLIIGGSYWIAAIVFIIAGLTDFLDGLLARKLSIQTEFGTRIDPLADKIFITLSLLSLWIIFQMPWIVLIIILARDLLIVIGWIFIMKKNKNLTLPPNLLGKATTFSQMSYILVFIIEKITATNLSISFYLAIIVVILTVSSGIYYAKRGYKILSRYHSFRFLKDNLPNKITFARILLIPIFIYLLMGDFQYVEYFAASLFIVIALTDALDGYVARKKGQQTKIGSMIDPLADKLLISSALIFLIGKGVDAWIAFAIIAREFVVTGLRTFTMIKGNPLPAKISGKIKTVSQIIAITFVILHIPLASKILFLSAIITIVSGIEYIWGERHLFKEIF